MERHNKNLMNYKIQYSSNNNFSQINLHRFNKIPIKIHAGIIITIKAHSKIYIEKKKKENQAPKTFVKEKEQMWLLLNFNTLYKTTV